MLFLPAIPGNPYLRSAFWMPGEAREIQFFSDLGACYLRNQRDHLRATLRSCAFGRGLCAQEAIDIREENERIRFQAAHDQRGKAVIVIGGYGTRPVTNGLEFRGRNRVIFVDDGQDTKAASLSIVRRGLEYRCQLLKSSSVSKT
jgi:hypothetical protein